MQQTCYNFSLRHLARDHNCLIINVIHFVVQGVVEDDFFVVAREFSHAGTDRRGYNLVIIAVGEVKSAIVVVVGYIVVNHDHGFPGVEDGVGDDGSKRRAADDVVAIEVAAVNTVVEVVGSSVVVNRSDVMGHVHVIVIVVVVRVYVGCVGCVSSGTCARTSGMSGTSRMSGIAAGLSTGVVAAGTVVTLVAGTRHRLRLSYALFGVSAFLRGGSCLHIRTCGGTGCVDGSAVGRFRGRIAGGRCRRAVRGGRSCRNVRRS